MRRLDPLVPDGAARVTPSVDRVRRNLGGRASTEAGAGQVVHVGDGPVGMLGVVVFRRGSTVDVLVGDGTIRRTRSDRIASVEDDEGTTLRAVAEDARAFGRLAEGDRVRFADPRHGNAEGRLIEKCRYGALVLRDDETIVGVGFRKIRRAYTEAARS